MDERLYLHASTLCFLLAVARSVFSVRAGGFQPTPFTFFAVLAGFVLQTLFLYFRGEELGRCPLTNLFEVFAFLAWAIALFYMAVGPVYRLSLMGTFTAPLVFLLQAFALLMPIDRPPVRRIEVNPWLEFHASMSMLAYGAFALACIAGLMYLLQERQLKARDVHSLFRNLPPLTTLYAAMTRLVWVGFALYTAGIASGFFTGQPLPVVKMILAVAVWVLYAVILQGRHWGRLAPRRVAGLCVAAFIASVGLLWGITFISERPPVS